MSAVIQAHGLARRFGRIQAVEAVDLELERGQMLGLVGPDGAGKTTTMRMLCGILAPSAGSAQVLGCDLVSQRDAIRRQVGYLAQQFSLYEDLTVDENIEFCARIHDLRDFSARRDELLEFTRLGEFRSRLAARLSGGMKQKLALACTLVHRPELILLDEPTTGVDPVSRREFWHILADLLSQGISIVLTTPYLDEAERCTRVALLHAGRSIRCADPQTLVEGMPGTLLEVRTADSQAALRTLRAWPGARDVHQVGECIHLVVDGRDVGGGGVRRRLRTAGVTGVQVRAVPARLEDVFIYLITSRAAENPS